MNEAVLYTRVSSDEQRKSGYSLDYQEKQGREYAAKTGLKIVKVYTESYTAKKPGRPLFNEMLSFVKKQKIRHIIFLKCDRASRNGIDSATLVYMAERDIFNIHLIQDNLCLNRYSKPTDYLVFEMNNVFANFYPRNLSVDVSTKLREKAEQGHYPVTAPVGYINKRQKSRSYIQINPEKAHFVKKVFELYASGQYSYRSLAKKMREEGFYISPAVKCGKSNIEDILNNPIYMGDFVYKGKRYYEGKHEPIISRELYALCQQIIKERTTPKFTRHDFAFSNLLKCEHCGCYMVGELKKGKYIYYHCTGNKGGNCKSKSYVREEKIEEAILEALKKIHLSDDTIELAKKCFRSELESQNLYSEQQIKTLEAEIQKQKNKASKLFDLFLEGEVSEDIYKKKKNEIEESLDGMLIKYSNLTKHGVKFMEYFENLFELFRMTSELYFELDNAKKRTMLKLLCSNLSYNGENVTITIKKAFQPIVKIAFLEKLGMKRLELPRFRTSS